MIMSNRTSEHGGNGNQLWLLSEHLTDPATVGAREPR
jgi:hypothetical protein